MSMPLIARAAPAPMPWLASYSDTLFHTPPRCYFHAVDELLQVVSISFATVVCARPWWRLAPAREPLVGRHLDHHRVALHRGAVAEPTRFCGAMGNETGYALTSAIFTGG